MTDSRKLAIEGAQAFGKFFSTLGEPDAIREIVLDELFTALRGRTQVNHRHTNQVDKVKNEQESSVCLFGTPGQEGDATVDDNAWGGASTNQTE